MEVGVALTLIAITCRHSFADGFSIIEDDYIRALEEAGGQPMVLPPSLSPRASVAALDYADGLLLSGGNDLSPLIFAEQPQPKLQMVDSLRDEQEMVMVEAALRKGLPILGICRGMQVINVALGGGIIQHIEEESATAIQHRQKAPGWHRHHQINVLPNTLLGSILGEGVVGVNSYHHQAVGALGRDLIVSARSPDGLVEAIESSSPWILGVQWHPERMYSRHREFFRIFSTFIAVAREKTQ